MSGTGPARESLVPSDIEIVHPSKPPALRSDALSPDHILHKPILEVSTFAVGDVAVPGVHAVSRTMIEFGVHRPAGSPCDPVRIQATHTIWRVATWIRDLAVLVVTGVVLLATELSFNWISRVIWLLFNLITKGVGIVF